MEASELRRADLLRTVEPRLACESVNPKKSELEVAAAPCGTVSSRFQTSLWRWLRAGSS